MSDHSLTHPQAAQRIRAAWYRGRTIVPIVGAGLSASSGVPTIASVVRYLAKFDSYLANRVMFPARVGNPRDLLKTMADKYRSEPTAYVADNGWPDRFQLNDDLRQFLRKNKEHQGISAEIREVLQRLAKRLSPKGFETLGKLLGGLEQSKQDELIHSSDESLHFSLLSDWKPLIREICGFNGHLADALFASLHTGRKPGLPQRYLAFLVKLLGASHVFTFNFDPLIETALADERVTHRVFAMEHGAELPPKLLLGPDVAVIKMHGSTHHLLIDERVDHLLPALYKSRFDEITGPNPLLLILGCSGQDRRLCDLVEHAVRRNRADFIWCRYSSRPDSPFELQTISEEVLTSDHFAYTSLTDAGLFLASVYQHLTSRFPSSDLPYQVQVSRSVPLSDLTGQTAAPTGEKDLRPITVFDGGVLKSVEERGASARVGKDDDVPRTINRSERALGGAEAVSGGGAQGVRGFTFLESNEDFQRLTMPPAYRELLQFAKSLPAGYNRIWIELEQFYTLGDVVAEIVNQCRIADIHLSPPLFPVGHSDLKSDGNEPLLLTPRGAAEIVYRAIGRTRCAVVFDGLEAFPWRFSTHHGLTTDAEDVVGQYFKDLCEFLRELSSRVLSGGYWKPGDSLLCMCVDQLVCRHVDYQKENDHLKRFQGVFEDQLGQLRTSLSPDFWRVCEPGKFKPAETDGKRSRIAGFLGASSHVPATPHSLAVFAASCFRRTRPIVALRSLLRDVCCTDDLDATAVESESFLHGVLEDLAATGVLIECEGAAFAMARPLRNSLYDAYTSLTSQRNLLVRMDDVASAGADVPAALETKYVESLQQLLLLIALHDRIARYYYSEAFLASLDPNCFLEYVYHRTSAMRYVGSAIAMFKAAKSNEKPLAKRVMDGLRHLPAWKRLVRIPIGSPLEFDNKAPFSEFENDPNGSLSNLRKAQLEGMIGAWQRSDGLLRELLPSERLIEVCRVLRRHDLEARLQFTNEENWLRVVDAKTPCSEAIKIISKMEKDPHDSTLKTLAQEVANTEAKCQYERGGFDALIQLRWTELRATLDGGGGESVEPAADGERSTKASPATPSKSRDAKERTKNGATVPLRAPGGAPDAAPRDSRELEHSDCAKTFQAWVDAANRKQAQAAKKEGTPHQRTDVDIGLNHWLDILVCLHWIGFSHARKMREAYEGWFDDLKGAFENHLKGAGHGTLEEIKARFAFVGIEAALGRFAVHGTSVDDASKSSVSGWSQEGAVSQQLGALKDLYNRCTTALEYVRDASLVADKNWFSPFLNPTSDRTLYIPFRSLFHILRGRTLALMEGLTGRTPHEPPFGPYREFEAARYGVGKRNRVVLAWADLSAAEVAIGGAESALVRSLAPPVDGRPDLAADGDVKAYVEAKLRTCRRYVRQAFARLERGSRNVVVWRLYHGLTARYNAVRSILKLCESVPRPGIDARKPGTRWHSSSISGVFRRLRDGVAAIKAGLDYTHPKGERFIMGFREQWWSLLLAGSSLGLVVIADSILAGDPPVSGDDSLHDLLFYWKNINASAGIRLGDKWENVLLNNAAEVYAFDGLAGKCSDDEQRKQWKEWREGTEGLRKIRIDLLMPLAFATHADGRPRSSYVAKLIEKVGRGGDIIVVE